MINLDTILARFAYRLVFSAAKPSFTHISFNATVKKAAILRVGKVEDGQEQAYTHYISFTNIYPATGHKQQAKSESS